MMNKSRVLLLILLSVVCIARTSTQVSTQSSFGSHRVKRQESSESIGSSEQKLVIIAPKYIKPHSSYHVLVSLADSSSPANIHIDLIAARGSNRSRAATETVLASSDGVQLVALSIGDWPDAEYTLAVNAKAIDGSWNFTAENEIVYREESSSYILKTDKAIYAPGQQVKVRALFVSPENRPVELKNEINVTMLDAKQTVIKQWVSLSNHRGLLSLDVPLPENLQLGKYTVLVNAKGLEHEKQFTVTESACHVCVTMQLPSYLTYNDTEIAATVKTSYSDGKPVQGRVTLTIKTFNVFNKGRVIQYRSRLTSDGVAYFPNFATKKLTGMEDQEIEFSAVVEEDQTGLKYSRTQTLMMHANNIRIEQLDRAQRVKTNNSIYLRYKVVYQDGTPVEDDGPEVELKYSGSLFVVYMEGPTNTFKLRPRGGLIEHELNLNFLESRNLYRKVSANYVNQNLNPLSVFYGPDYWDIRIDLPQFPELNRCLVTTRPSNGRISINDVLKVEVSLSERWQQVTCHGLSRGDIVWALSRRVQGETKFEFDVKLDQRMVPKMRIICFGTRERDKHLIADAFEVPVSDLKTPRVEVSASSGEAGLGKDVVVSVSADPDSLVGLLEIDQSALLQGSDEEQNQISLECTNCLIKGNIDECVFDRADVVVLTNTLFAQESSGRKPAQHLFLPEMRQWQDKKANSRGQIEFNANMHDMVGSWQLSAFSMSESHGLVVTEDLTPDRAVKQFFIRLNLPRSIILGETINITATLHNYSKKPIKAKLTLDNQRDELEFIEAADTVQNERGSSNTSESRRVTVSVDSSAPISFLVKPTKLGLVEVRAVAHARTIGDGVVKRVLVKPPGREQHMNETYLVRLAGSESSWRHNVSIKMPENAVEGSQKVLVSVNGDFSGAGLGLSNLDNLLQEPHADGKQQLIDCVQNIVVFSYLKAIRRLDPFLEDTDFSWDDFGQLDQSGVVRVLADFDKAGSVSLYAYLLKTLQQAKSSIVMPNYGPAEFVPAIAASFIARNVQPDGRIEEVGPLHNITLVYSSLQHNARSIYLTAYSLVALLLEPIAFPLPTIDHNTTLLNQTQLEEVIQRSLNYLERQLDRNSGNSSNSSALATSELAIIAYTMSLAGSKHQIAADRAYEMLWGRANKLNDHAWWSNSKINDKNDRIEARTGWLASWAKPKSDSLDWTAKTAHVFDRNSLEVEVSSWALLATTKRREIERALPIARWLITQQRSDGGFGSTKVNVLAIEALAKFAEASMSTKSPLSIDFEFDYPRSKSTSARNDSLPTGRTNLDRMHVSESDALVQLTRLPDNITWLQIQANGTGSAVVQVSWQYNLLA